MRADKAPCGQSLTAEVHDPAVPADSHQLKWLGTPRITAEVPSRVLSKQMPSRVVFVYWLRMVNDS